MTQTCDNACKTGWCCRGWFINLPNDEGAVLLAVKRGFKVYRLKTSFIDGFVAHDKSGTCVDLTPDGMCRLQADKPEVCREFPDGGVHILADECPYEGPFFIKLKDTIEVTEDNIKEQFNDHRDRCRI